MMKKKTNGVLVKWFEAIGIEDVPEVGGKNASLGEMYRELAPQGVLSVEVGDPLTGSIAAPVTVR